MRTKYYEYMYVVIVGGMVRYSLWKVYESNDVDNLLQISL